MGVYYVWDKHVGTISTLVSTSSNFYVILPYWVQDIYDPSQVASTAILLRST